MDAGSIRKSGGKLKELYLNKKIQSFGEVGVRLHLNYFYKAIFRLDYGVEFGTDNPGAFSFGIGQFF